MTTPSWLTPGPEPLCAVARRAAWTVWVLQQLGRQDLSAEDHLRILLGAAGHLIARHAPGQEVETLDWAASHLARETGASLVAQRRHALALVQPAGEA